LLSSVPTPLVIDLHAFLGVMLLDVRRLLMDEDPNNDATAPCNDCGDACLSCACVKPIETLAELQRAVEVSGIHSINVRRVAVAVGPYWDVTLHGPTNIVGGFGSTLGEAMNAAIDAWWK
jgi:hypothetical protein